MRRESGALFAKTETIRRIHRVLRTSHRVAAEYLVHAQRARFRVPNESEFSGRDEFRKRGGELPQSAGFKPIVRVLSRNVRVVFDRYRCGKITSIRAAR